MILMAAPPVEATIAIVRHLTAQGWQVTAVDTGAAAVAMVRRTRFDVIWLAADLAQPGVQAVLARLDDDARDRTLVVDPDIPVPAPSVLRQLADTPFTPAPRRNEALDGIMALLGAAETADLLLRFRHSLDTLLDGDDPDAVAGDTGPNELAHRIGGLAGLLGFADLAAAWLLVEARGNAHLLDALIETRIARAALDLLIAREAIP